MSHIKVTGWSLFAAGVGLAAAASRYRRHARRFNFRGASVVITGGSRGLGLELARLFAEEKASLALIARNGDELEGARRILEQQGADVITCIGDVGNAREVSSAVEAVVSARKRIDVLVNNAGIVQVGPYEHMDRQDFVNAMAVHAWGPLNMIEAVTPVMKRQGGGRIVNISSIGGIMGVPHLVPYCMSKFALTGLSESLRPELAKDNIRVTTVAPGLMRTGSHVNALFKGQHRKEYAWFAISDTNPLLSTSARRAARKIVEACRYGDSRLIIGLPAKAAFLTTVMVPGIFAACTEAAARLLPDAVGPEGNTTRNGRDSSSTLAPSFLTVLGDRMVGRNNEETELH